MRSQASSCCVLRIGSQRKGHHCPGPGLLRSSEWIKVAKHLLDNKRIILHTDGAKAYMADFEQFRHTRVTHKVKKGDDGKWIKPRYVEPVEVSAPNGSLSLLAGTEAASIKHVSNPSADLDDCIRVAQRRYWSQGQCPWEALEAILAPQV
eukprot:6490491-Amphidinium_carterae.3